MDAIAIGKKRKRKFSLSFFFFLFAARNFRKTILRATATNLKKTKQKNESSMRSTLLCSLVVVCCVVAVVVGTSNPRQVLVGLSVVPNTPRLILGFNITNPSSDANPLAVLSWGTPMEGGINGPIFEVTDVFGNKIPYIGKLVRRSW